MTEMSAEAKMWKEWAERLESMLRNARNILADGGYVYVKEIDKYLEPPRRSQPTALTDESKP
jgi:UDP:flavonoid glycosyltransferase YjiC (YdhE family)